MQCPVCDEKLRTIERLGVELDICPSCKGIWLDRGELDKILEMDRAAGRPEAAPAEVRESAPPPRGGEQRYRLDHHDDDHHHDDHDDHDDHHDEHHDDRPYGGSRDEGNVRPGQKKRGGWLGDLLGGLGEGGGD